MSFPIMKNTELGADINRGIWASLLVSQIFFHI